MAATENRSEIVPAPPAKPWLFKPGNSANPGGRPKGLAELVRRETKDGAELVRFMLGVLRGRKQPLRYRLEAAAWLADRGFGKALPQMELSGPGAEPLTIRIEYAEEAAVPTLTISRLSPIRPEGRLRPQQRFNALLRAKTTRSLGKTTLGIDRLVRGVWASGRLRSPYRMLTEVWRDCRRIGAPVVHRYTQQHRIELVGVRHRDVEPDQPDVARGRKYALVGGRGGMVRDRKTPAAVLRPTLVDSAGGVVFEHAQGLNYWRLFDLGNDPGQEDRGVADAHRATSYPLTTRRPAVGARADVPPRIPARFRHGISVSPSHGGAVAVPRPPQPGTATRWGRPGPRVTTAPSCPTSRRGGGGHRPQPDRLVGRSRLRALAERSGAAGGGGPRAWAT
jgi:hypothetical protein